jgi:hypothetical protein
MEKKYIVELYDENVKSVAGYDWLQLLISVADKSVMVETAIQLLPYTESDIEKNVREEAYEKGYQDAVVKIGSDEQAIAEKAYQSGLSDAWEAARKLVLDSNHGGLTNYDIEEIFGVDEEQAIINYSASEAIEKIRQYEQEQEMGGLRQNIQTIVDQCGYTLDEIAEVLAKMKEGS